MCLRVCVCVFTVHTYIQYPLGPEEGGKVWVTGPTESCELPDEATDNQTLVLCKKNRCSEMLSLSPAKAPPILTFNDIY